MATSDMYDIKRNMQTCQGEKSCGRCIEWLPGLAEGNIPIAGWAKKCNQARIDNAIAGCPVFPEPALSIKKRETA